MIRFTRYDRAYGLAEIGKRFRALVIPYLQANIFH